jgi:threonine dehydrogenase-like Zn-dependent dehydrogenase
MANTTFAAKACLPVLMKHIQMGEIDPSLSIAHRATRKERPDRYETFRDKQDGCKVVVRP